MMISSRNAEHIRTESLLTSDPMSSLSRVVINAIDACNRRCSFCPRSNTVAYPPQMRNKMSVAGATLLASTMRDMNFKGTYSITGWSEPLLHAGILKVIEQLNVITPSATIEMQTNGDKLRADTIPLLYNIGLSKLIINVYDGPSQLTSITALVDNISNVVPVGFVEIVSKYNGEFEGMNNRAGSFENTDGILAPLMSPLSTPCYMPFYKIAVDWNLDVYFCDYDWKKTVMLGNLTTTSMKDIWLGDTVMKIRRQLFMGNRTLSPCSKCNVQGTIHGSTQADIIMRWDNDRHELCANVAAQ